ncbi:MAG: PepSY-associated TM helix domain-containing protein [Vicinamibacterales bacterium]
MDRAATGQAGLHGALHGRSRRCPSVHQRTARQPRAQWRRPRTRSQVGRSVLGMVALLVHRLLFATWLTFPVALQQFWQRWKPSWLVKRGASAYRTNLDVHRASGLWLWPLLLVFAWSSVMLNFGPLHRAISRTVLAYPSAQEEAQRRDRMRAEAGASPFTMREALAVGQRLAATEAQKRIPSTGPAAC